MQLSFNVNNYLLMENHCYISESGGGPVCVEETAAESRSARLALRRAALRRHVVRAHTGLKLARDYRDDRALATLIKVIL